MLTNPKRVLFLDHTATLGGGEIALLNLVTHLDSNRYTPVVVLFSDGPLVDRLIYHGIETHILPLDPAIGDVRKDSIGLGTFAHVSKAFTAATFILNLNSLIRRLNPDLVHTNSLKSDILGGAAARLAGKPLIWHMRDRLAADYLPHRVAHVMRVLARQIPDHVIAISHAVAQTLSATTQPPQRITVVHDGTILRNSSVDRESSPSLTVGLVGRISAWKGQDVFIRAAARLHEGFPNVRFRIIGAALFSEQEYEKIIRSLVTELKLDRTVEFCGFRTDIANAIDELDILVHASTVPEPFGQVIIEGMAAGKPVIATNAGGAAEIIRPDVDGLLVPLGDHDALAHALQSLIRSPDLRQRLGAAGRRRVAEHFTIAYTAAKVQDVFDHILRPAQQWATRSINAVRSTPISLSLPVTTTD
jgi:glycosyltransferase involved in cell wall biosynthesis